MKFGSIVLNEKEKTKWKTKIILLMTQTKKLLKRGKKSDINFLGVQCTPSSDQEPVMPAQPMPMSRGGRNQQK